MGLYEKRLNNALPGQYQDMINYYDCWLCGGAVLSLVLGTEINDFDLYFKDKYQAYEFYKELEGTIISVTDKSIVVKRHDDGDTYFFNLILFKYFNYAQEIFDSFDFTCCKAAWTGKKFIYDSKFMQDVASRRIVYTPSFRYPIASLLRVNKYKDKGFEISRNEMLKIIFQVSQHKIDSLEKLEEELGSIYGISLKKIYPEGEEFSINRMIEILSNLPDDLFSLTEGTSADDLELPQVFKDIEEEYEKRTFDELYLENEYEYQGDKYCITTPKSKEDIEQEGRALKHCVGSYIGNVIRGDCKILFLRKKDDINQSLLTIDLRKREIKSVKGNLNRDMNIEEINFLKEYCKIKGFKIKVKGLLKFTFYKELKDKGLL